MSQVIAHQNAHQVGSFSGPLVNGVNNYLAPSDRENLIFRGIRITTRAAFDTLLTPVAIVEALFFAFLTVVTLPLSILPSTRPLFNWAKQHAGTASEATQNAVFGILGYGDSKNKTEVEKPEEDPAIAAEENSPLYNFLKSKTFVTASIGGTIAYLSHRLQSPKMFWNAINSFSKKPVPPVPVPSFFSLQTVSNHPYSTLACAIGTLFASLIAYSCCQSNIRHRPGG